MEKTITKDILKNELYSGEWPAVDLIYARYGGMLYSYLLQFMPEREQAEDLLVEVFSRLAARLSESFDSSLSIYCWLQVEARKIVLEYVSVIGRGGPNGENRTYYTALLEDASPEHQWVFRELFLYGRTKDELAVQVNKDTGYITSLLGECLLIIRKKIG